jgi:GNAT superfamily N-acetyltransferase
MLHLTRELEAAILQSERAGILTGVATAQRLFPDIRAEYIEIAGGIAVFTGPESPLSEAYGVGAEVPVSDEDIARITSFYESRNAKPRVYVTPLSDPSLATALAAAGYAPVEYVNFLASDDFETAAPRDDRTAPPTDLVAWAAASIEAFADGAFERSGDSRIATILAQSEGALLFEIRIDGAIAATAAMDIRGGCATLFGGSTLPNFRKRGLHVALIRERIARARDAGARFMRAGAAPGSTSERNFQRCGFVTLYTRTLWERRARCGKGFGAGIDAT